jgi:hypothetical protein
VREWFRPGLRRVQESWRFQDLAEHIADAVPWIILHEQKFRLSGVIIECQLVNRDLRRFFSKLFGKMRKRLDGVVLTVWRDIEYLSKYLSSVSADIDAVRVLAQDPEHDLHSLPVIVGILVRVERFLAFFGVARNGTGVLVGPNGAMNPRSSKPRLAFLEDVFHTILSEAKVYSKYPMICTRP